MPRSVNKTIKPRSLILDVLPLRRMVIAPGIITPLLVGRSISIKAVENALQADSLIVCITQKQDDNNESPKAADLERYGTACRVLQSYRLPDGNLRILVEGEDRVKVVRFLSKHGFMQAEVVRTPKLITSDEPTIEANMRLLKDKFQEYVRTSRAVPDEVINGLSDINDPVDCIYFVLSTMEIDNSEKQRIFEIEDIETTFEHLLDVIQYEIQIHQLEKQLDHKVKGTLNKMQREYYLTEQLKAIYKELGITQDGEEELLELKKRITELPLSPEAKKRAEEELKRLYRITNHSQDYGVSYSYLQWILDIPWVAKDDSKFELKAALETLDTDHYGLNKIKERILEFLAVMKLSNKSKGQILCFVGPPGVGKTSLGQSIAKALGRSFVRISLGGVRDEAEIRGHRRTYVGAIPGVIIQSMKKAGSTNPLIMMDEIDKMSMDFRGDPASALLEVLDPEQNFDFRDHYLDFGYDLSKVMFITTANHIGGIPRPLLDRMEVITLPGYTRHEKFEIAKRHLLPRQIDRHEIKGNLQVSISDKAIWDIIDTYTRESGVRELERKIATVLRKLVKQYFETNNKTFKVSNKQLPDLLGLPVYQPTAKSARNQIGVVNGLAWTSVGGEILSIEMVRMPGDGKVRLTGKLGEVMKESASAAFSLARIKAKKYGYSIDLFKKNDIHMHIPEGAVPKDGPSAGVSILTALVSVLSQMPVRNDVAMTGEISLTGAVLPIGGLQEKLMAALRAGIKEVIIPAKNQPELKEMQQEIIDQLVIHPVKTVDEVLSIALIK